MRISTSFLTLLLVLNLPVLADNGELISFEMENQLGEKYSDDDFRGKILIVFASDRGGSKYNKPWAAALVDTLKKLELKSAVRILGVADLRGVPFFLKGMVRGKFPDDRRQLILMDWKGQFAKNYDLEKDKSNILIFSRDSRLLYRHTVAGFEKQPFNRIVNELTEIINLDPPDRK